MSNLNELLENDFDNKPPLHHQSPRTHPSAVTVNQNQHPTTDCCYATAHHPNGVVTNPSHFSPSTTACDSTIPGGSSSVWRPSGRWPESSEEKPSEIRARKFKSCLNKLTVEKFACLAEQAGQLVNNITSSEELQCFIDLVIDKSLSEQKFLELYSDLFLVMRWRSPLLSLSSDNPIPATSTPHRSTSSSSAKESECSHPRMVASTPPTANAKIGCEADFRKAALFFTSLLLSSLQEEFETMTKYFELPQPKTSCIDASVIGTADCGEDVNGEAQKVAVKTKMIGMCRLVGDLYIRKIIKSSTVQEIVKMLLGLTESAETFNEDLVECVCAFCCAAGSFMDSNPSSARYLSQIFGRLSEIQNLPKCESRLRYIIQDMFDARKANWHQRTHKEKAMALSQVKDEAEREEAAGGGHIIAQAGKVTRLGNRVNLLNGSYHQFLTQQEDLFRQKTGGM